MDNYTDIQNQSIEKLIQLPIILQSEFFKNFYEKNSGLDYCESVDITKSFLEKFEKDKMEEVTEIIDFKVESQVKLTDEYKEIESKLFERLDTVLDKNSLQLLLQENQELKNQNDTAKEEMLQKLLKDFNNNNIKEIDNLSKYVEKEFRDINKFIEESSTNCDNLTNLLSERSKLTSASEQVIILQLISQIEFLKTIIKQYDFREEFEEYYYNILSVSAIAESDKQTSNNILKAEKIEKESGHSLDGIKTRYLFDVAGDETIILEDYQKTDYFISLVSNVEELISNFELKSFKDFFQKLSEINKKGDEKINEILDKYVDNFEGVYLFSEDENFELEEESIKFLKEKLLDLKDEILNHKQYLDYNLRNYANGIGREDLKVIVNRLNGAEIAESMDNLTPSYRFGSKFKDYIWSALINKNIERQQEQQTQQSQRFAAAGQDLENASSQHIQSYNQQYPFG